MIGGGGGGGGLWHSCNNSLRLKSPLTRSTDHLSLLKHRNFDFAHFLRGGDSYLKSDF